MLLIEGQGSNTKTVQLSQLSKVIFQGLFSSRKTKLNNLSRKIRLINIKDIVDGQISPVSIETVVIDIHKNIDRYIVLPGDVIVTCRGTILKSAVVPESLKGYLITSNLVAIRLNGNFDPLLLSAFFQSPIGQRILLSSARSSTMQIALTVSDIGKIEVPLIPLEIQKKLAGLIAASDQYYKLALDAAGLRRDIAIEIILDSFIYPSNHPNGGQR